MNQLLKLKESKQTDTGPNVCMYIYKYMWKFITDINEHQA